ncbi:MAG: CcmD family protein [Acidobacteria bacterium]|nr:CcmD family protein [Acidobacteriota bacterium]
MTTQYLFWGYLAGFVLVAAFVARLAFKLSNLERRLEQLQRERERP